MEDISCIFCGNQSDHIAITENGYVGRKCQDCNLIFISPRPSAAEVTHLYTEEHAVQYAEAQFQFERFKRMRARLTLAKIKNYKKSGSILELGPGGGSFIVEARNNGYEPCGIELNPIEAQWIEDKLLLPCENVPLNADSFDGKQFDIIYHNDVLSHLYDPIDAFCNMNRALKNNGFLIFETGNIADVDKKYYKYYSQFMYPDHLFFFGEHSINLLLERTGYKFVRIYREAELIPMLLKKVLWSVKDSLKDKQVLEDIKMHKRFNSKDKGQSVRKQLRILYRYLGYYLMRIGGILPKNGRPLRLLILAEKKSGPRPF